MYIQGLQKLTLLDYPEKLACTVFTAGCNFRCPFCHNASLVRGTGEEPMAEEDFFAFLQSRRGILEGVCVTGGEPTLHHDLPELLRQIRSLGFSVKLDTNGSRPEVLKSLAAQKLVDYVAVDAKNGPEYYAQTVGTERLDMAALEESLRFLIEGNVDYELRTTLVEPLHTEESIAEMGKWLASLVPGKKPKRLFLQSFVDRDTVIFSGLSAPEEATVERYGEILAEFVETVTIRNK